MRDYKVPVTITIRRTLPNVIEYNLTFHDPLSGDQTRTYHANREATFFGPHTGAPARQIEGGARTLWRGDDAAMLLAFQREYNGDRIRNITLEG